MKSLPLPKFTVREVLDVCVSGVRDRGHALRLASVMPAVEAAEGEYLRLGLQARLFEVEQTPDVAGVISSLEMSKLYKGNLARKGSRSRRFYDRLKMAAPGDICPLCNQRVVKTLDHYLPKADYPSLAVTPLNLVPACSDCNKDKLDRNAASAAEQTLHPYFDAVDDAVWLVAEIQESSPPAAVFAVRAPASWAATKRRRVETHFLAFGLGVLYAAQSGAELVSIRYALAEVAECGGADAVRAFLNQQARSRAMVSRNSWSAALYSALSASQWFCSEGFLELG